MDFNMMKNKKTNKCNIFAVLLSIITMLSLVPASVLADGNRDISNFVVESIVTKNAEGSSETDTISIWDSFQVEVTFSEDDADGNRKPEIDIQSGDQINISWSSPEGVELVGYTNTIDLEQNEIVIAKAVITETGGTITFNDNVNDLQHVKGTINFSISARRTATLTEEKVGTIVSGEKTKSITIRPSSGSNPGKFNEKSGEYATDGTNIINWDLSVNRDYQTNIKDTVTIVDELPDTETIVDGFFQIDLLSKSGEWSTKGKTLEAINALEGYFASVNGNVITVSIPAEDLNSNDGSRCYVSFQTISTATAGSKVINDMKATHFELGSEDPIVTTDSEDVTVPNSGGSIEGVPKGTIRINKVVNGTTDPIEGVHFYVYRVNSETDHTRVSGWYNDQDHVEIISGEDGIASIANLEDGYYEIEEIPDDLPNWIAVTSISDNLFVSLGGNAGTSVDIENSVKTIDVSATKIWEKEDGTSDDGEHPTVYFLLCRSVENEDPETVSDAEIKKIDTQTGDDSTTVTWNELPQYDNTGREYTYFVQEVDEAGTDFVPEGYHKDESGLTVTNTKEPTTPNEPTTPDEPSTPNKSNTPDKVTSPKTGDESNIPFVLTLCVFALLGLVSVPVYRRK